MSIKVQKAKYYDLKGIAEDIATVMSKYADLAEEDFERTTKTWNRDVDFNKKTTLSRGKFEAEIFTKDEIYYYLNEGTSVRFAVMTQDFKPKTKPGVLDSFPGQGGLAYVNPRTVRQPGIKAREFTKAIAKKHGKDFVRDIQKASAKNADNLTTKMQANISIALNVLRRLF